MEIEASINVDADTDHIIPQTRVFVSNQVRHYLGIPKRIDGEHIDSEHCSWSASTLLCACTFLEDAVNYQSIVHKVTQRYLHIYRWSSSPLIRKLHSIALMINLCLAFFEQPSSFSRTSDVRDKPSRIVFSYLLLMMIEVITLLWFFIYICTKIACHGIQRSRKRFWHITFLVAITYSLCEWFVMTSYTGFIYHGIRYRRIFRPLFLIESSQLMKKALKSIQKDLLIIVACLLLALTHILFFATIAMFLFPRSETRKDSQGSTYFSNLHDSAFNLLVLYSTANNPDIMMPAYSDYRLNALFFIIFIIIGIYCIQNLITAVVYRAFRGYFLNSIINCQLQRRVATRASFEVLRKRITNAGSIETRDNVPISIVRTVVDAVSMGKWYSTRITESLSELQQENETIDLDQYFKVMEILDLNPKLVSKSELPELGQRLSDQLKAVGRSKIFDSIGTVIALLSVLLTTIEVINRHVHIRYEDLVDRTLAIACINFSLTIFFFGEILIKTWAFGPKNFFRSSSAHVLEAFVALACLTLQLAHMGIYGTPAVSKRDFDLRENQMPFITLWEAIKACNMLFIYRLVRFLPASTNIQIIVGTVVDEIRNGGAFFGVLFSFYYAYSIFGMVLFRDVVDNLNIQKNDTNITICGTYQQLEYWPNNFNDFFSSIITLYNIMIVNQWFVFVDAFRDATNTKWSELYFIFWYFFVTTIGLNICLALSGDIYDAKKKRADQHEELIVSNLFDIYRSELNEPPPEVIIKKLNAHPYINFQEN